MNHVISGGRVSGRGNSECKCPEVGMSYECSRNSKQTCRLERREGRVVVGEEVRDITGLELRSLFRALETIIGALRPTPCDQAALHLQVV